MVVPEWATNILKSLLILKWCHFVVYVYLYLYDFSGTDKRVSFSECVEVTEVEGAGSEAAVDHVEATGEIDEEKIDQLLHVLHEADPTGERSDPPELAFLEGG